jgi:hypothetical protein
VCFVFKLFGRLAILLAIGTFFAECPTRLREARFANLRAVEAAQHTEASRARVEALEKLNEGCFDLAGIHAERAQLRGLRLDRCQHFFKEVTAGAEKAARDRGELPPTVRESAEPGTEGRKEKEIVERLITERFDGILIDPEAEHASVPAARIAFRKGLVLVCYDHCIDPREHAILRGGRLRERSVRTRPRDR